MKKVFAIAFVAASFALVSCGSKEAATAAADSLAAAVDSSVTAVVDSTVTVAVDSAAAKVDSVATEVKK